MTHEASHQLVAYRRDTEVLEFEWPVPDGSFAMVAEIARVPSSDPEAIGAYALDQDQVDALAQVLGLTLPSSFQYYLEPAYEEA